jgi:hypothetical protein
MLEGEAGAVREGEVKGVVKGLPIPAQEPQGGKIALALGAQRERPHE